MVVRLLHPRSMLKHIWVGGPFHSSCHLTEIIQIEKWVLFYTSYWMVGDTLEMLSNDGLIVVAVILTGFHLFFFIFPMNSYQNLGYIILLCYLHIAVSNLNYLLSSYPYLPCMFSSIAVSNLSSSNFEIWTQNTSKSYPLRRWEDIQLITQFLIWVTTNRGWDLHKTCGLDGNLTPVWSLFIIIIFFILISYMYWLLIKQSYFIMQLHFQLFSFTILLWK